MTTVKRAESLGEIYDVFDPTKSLEGEYLDEFYVEIYRANQRYGKLFDQLKNPLLGSTSQDKFLFGGFKGCGKSTELNKLCADKDIRDKFLVVKFTVREELNIADFDYKDLLMVCVAKIYNCAREENVKISEEVIKNIEEWAFGLTIIKTEKEGYEGEVGGRFDLWLSRILGLIKFGSEKKIEMRKEIEPKTLELVGNINRMLEEIKRKGKKDVLLVIEDIDKLPLVDAEKLFSSYVSPFLQLNCKAIFTFPFALMSSPGWGVISRVFADFIILPNITIHKKEDNGKKNEENYEVMREIFRKRANENLIDKDALDEAIRYSGGVVFDFIRIIRNAANRASIYGKNKIEKDDIEMVAIKMGDGYSFLREEHIKKLKEIYEKKNLGGGEGEKENRIVMELLGTLSVLKYYNNEEWFDVHPIIEYKVKE